MLSGRDAQILFHPPDRPYEEIGMATAQGAQAATDDATIYSEVRSQAAKLGADAVIILGQEQRGYFNALGFVNLAKHAGSRISVRQRLRRNLQWQCTNPCFYTQFDELLASPLLAVLLFGLLRMRVTN